MAIGEKSNFDFKGINIIHTEIVMLNVVRKKTFGVERPMTAVKAIAYSVAYCGCFLPLSALNSSDHPRLPLDPGHQVMNQESSDDFLNPALWIRANRF